MPDLRPLIFFEIRVPKSSETSPEAMAACLKALPKLSHSLLDWFFKRGQAISLELVTWNQRIYFLAAIPTTIANYFHSQLTAQYPQALIHPVGDYLPFFFSQDTTIEERVKLAKFGQLCLSKPFYLPLKTYVDFKDVDPLSTVLGTLAKMDPRDKAIIQFLITAPPGNWQSRGLKVAHSTIPTSDPEKTMPHPQKSLIETKVAQIGLKVGINLLVISSDIQQADSVLTNIVGSFASFAHGEGNSLQLHKPFFWSRKAFLESMIARKPTFIPRSQVFTAEELASLYHLPNQFLANIRNIAWGGTLKGEPPENLPIAVNLTEEQKREINFFAKTEFKNQSTVFGIKRADRRKHIYIIGKTGVGKSTLIANMAINDMRNGEGLAIIDPHGDLCATVLDYIPSYRMNDVVYLDPNDVEYPFRLNPLQVSDPTQADLVASGIVAIFHKLFAHSWGPRLEYILRNTLLTLAQIPGTTLLDVIQILTHKTYRDRIMDKLQDYTLKNFWEKEFNKLDDRSRQDAISPILNKVGQFVTSPKLRTILERPHSSIDLEEIMNSKKILLLNLSQGKIGEDNAALLGAMFITKMQLAAMNRVNQVESDRQDFYLYVDEFQNFATNSFIKILSEARKYRLNLTLANQYIDQVEEEIQKAIFGNVGTLLTFLVGARDAALLKPEFGNIYEDADLVGLDNFEMIAKLSIDNRTSNPFPSKTLPLPFSKNQNREKVIRISQERYGKPGKSQGLETRSKEVVEPSKVENGENTHLRPDISVPPPFQQAINTVPPLNWENQHQQRLQAIESELSRPDLSPLPIYTAPNVFSPPPVPTPHAPMKQAPFPIAVTKKQTEPVQFIPSRQTINDRPEHPGSDHRPKPTPPSDQVTPLGHGPQAQSSADHSARPHYQPGQRRSNHPYKPGRHNAQPRFKPRYRPQQGQPKSIPTQGQNRDPQLHLSS